MIMKYTFERTNERKVKKRLISCNLESDNQVYLKQSLLQVYKTNQTSFSNYTFLFFL